MVHNKNDLPANPSQGDVIAVVGKNGSLSFYEYNPNDPNANENGYVGTGVQSKSNSRITVVATRTVNQTYFYRLKFGLPIIKERDSYKYKAFALDMELYEIRFAKTRSFEIGMVTAGLGPIVVLYSAEVVATVSPEVATFLSDVQLDSYYFLHGRIMPHRKIC